MKKKQVTAFLLAAVLGVSALMTGCGDSKKKKKQQVKKAEAKNLQHLCSCPEHLSMKIGKYGKKSKKRQV